MMRKSRQSVIAEINVVPYIDVMLVLLVIFMITTPLLQQGVKINLPQAQAKALDSESSQPLIVTVDAHGDYYLNVANDPEKPLSSQQLVTRIAAELTLAKQQQKKRAVLVRGDKAVVYDKIIHAMVLLQQAGAAEVGLMTNSQQQTADS